MQFSQKKHQGKLRCQKNHEKLFVIIHLIHWMTINGWWLSMLIGN